MLENKIKGLDSSNDKLKQETAQLRQTQTANFATMQTRIDLLQKTDVETNSQISLIWDKANNLNDSLRANHASLKGNY